MSPTNAKSPRRSLQGFTLLELVIAMTLAAIVSAAVFGGFTFLGRNLTRLVNAQDQDTKSRKTFYRLGQDISAATKIENTASAGNVQLNVQGLGTVKYVYDDQALTFTRTGPTPSAPSTIETTVLLTDLISLTFKYYNQAGTLLNLSSGENLDLAKSGIQSVKEIELSFVSAVGSPSSGTRSLYTGKSPRFVLRNRPLLQ